MRKWALSFLVLFFGASAVASNAVECRVQEGDVSSIFKIMKDRKGELRIQSGETEIRCRLEIVDVDDRREGVSPAVEVKARRFSACHPGDAAFEKKLTREISLLVSDFGEKRAYLHLFAGKGFRECQLKGYSASLLGLK